MWGHSPALDLQHELEASGTTSLSELTSVNILVAGAQDVRHVLRTLAQTYRHLAGRRLHLHVLESSIECMARQFLHLALALEPPEIMGLVQKTRTFLEIHGNTLVRPHTLQYIRHKATQLIYMVTDPTYLKSRLPMVNLDLLKYKERDFLENAFKFWKTFSQQDFDIINLWDQRLRSDLGVRYDTRQGIFDWDYHMKLNSSKDSGTPVTSQEYIGWRETGVAFRWVDSSECTETNPSFAASGSLSQHSYRVCQYSGDQLTGPYVSYGIECDDLDMVKKYNNRFVKTATDVSERNVLRMIYELVYRKPYEVELSPDDDSAGAVVMVPPNRPNLSRMGSESTSDSFLPREDYCSLTIDNVNITFLSPVTLEEDRPSARFRGSFQVIFVGQSLLPKLLGPALLGMAADQALLLLEGRQFVVGPRRCDVQEFNDKMLETAVEEHLEPVPADAEFNPSRQEVLRYIFTRQ